MPEAMFEIPNFAGGRNTREARNLILPNQSPDDLNVEWDQYGRTRRRKGMQLHIFDTWGGNPIMGLKRFIKTNGDRFTCVQVEDKLWAYKGVKPYSHKILVTFGLEVGVDRWFAQMKDWLYMTRWVDGSFLHYGVKRWDGGVNCEPAGLPLIDASLVLLTAGVGGRMDYANASPSYEYNYQFTNVFEDLGESPRHGSGDIVNYQPIGFIGTGTNGRVAISGLAAVTHPRAKFIRIYRTHHFSVYPRSWYGPYYFVEQLSAGTNTYNDDFNDAEIPVPADPDPLFNQFNFPNFKFVEPDPNGRMFWASANWPSKTQIGTILETTESRSRVYWSDFFTPDRLMGFEDFDPEDGDRITGIKRYDNRLVVFKNHKIFELVGAGPLSFRKNLIDPRIGCIAPRTIIVLDGILFWLASDGLYAWIGQGRPERVSENIRTDLEAIAFERQLAAACGASRGRLFLALAK